MLEDEEYNRMEHVARLQEDANVIPELSLELENHKLKIDELESQLQARTYEVQTLQNGLTNMQSLLEESQVNFTCAMLLVLWLLDVVASKRVAVKANRLRD